MTRLLYDLVYGLPICFISILVGKSMLGAPAHPIFALGVGVLTIGTCACLKYWENRLRFLVPGVFFAVYAGIVLIQKKEERVAFLLQNRWILWIILLATACFLIGRFAAQQKWIRRALGIAFLGDLLYALVFRLFPDKSVTAMELFFLLVCLVEEVQISWKKSGFTDQKGHLVSLLPFLLAMGLSIYLLPAPSKPFDWDFAVQIWRHVSEEIRLANRFFHRNSEDYGNVGFAESGDFWGNLQKRDKKVMEISGRADVGAYVYLPGKMMDRFDGRNWSAEYDYEGRDRMIDTLETLSAVTMQEPEFLQNYLWRVDLKCKYDEFNTKYLFVPIKPILGKDSLGDVGFLEQGFTLVAEEKLGYGTEYGISYFRLNQGHEQVKEFLRNLKPINAETWKEMRETYDFGGAGTSFEEYQNYKQRMQEFYCPETEVSDQVARYLQELFDGAESDYEKMERLEKSLSALAYNTSPGALPQEVDSPKAFLDYFLLELREGYCSHFATAFVLLARTQGIPARYVQGFYVNKGNDASAIVMTDMAHAWPEVYLEGYGWLAFEPTPGFRKVSRWEFRKTKDPAPIAETQEQIEEEREEQEVVLPEEEIEEAPPVRWYLILLPLLSGILFLVGFIVVDLVLSKKWYEGLAPEKKFYVTFWRNLKILALLGYRRNLGETLEEFMDRVLVEFEQDKDILERVINKEKPDLSFLEDYERVIYGGRKPDAEMNKRAEKSFAKLSVQLRRQTGKWYWWHYFWIISRKKMGTE